MSNYFWTVSGGFITAGGGTGNHTATVTWNTTGVQHIEVNYSNLLNCQGYSATVLPVTVQILPNTTISEAPGPNCENSSHDYFVPANPQCTFTWSVTPASRGTVTGGQGTNTVTVNWLNSGPATLGVTGTNSLTTCASTGIHLLEIHSKPQPDFQPCFDLLTTPSAKKYTLRGATPYIQGQSVFSGDRVSLNTLTGSYEFNPFGASPGVYPVTYTFTNTYGCSASVGPVAITVQSTSFSCGGDLTDIRDGRKYKTGLNGGMCWMVENLRFGNTLDPAYQPQTDNCVGEKYCQPSDAGCQNYGGLYHWDEVMKYGATSIGQGLCPPGWHIPSEADWQMLINNLVTGHPQPGDAAVSGPLKDMLLNPGFHALLNGFYYNNSLWSFTTGLPAATMYWTSTSNAQNLALARGVNTYSFSMSRYWSKRSNSFPVRCLKDQP
jgi:uncharacterized protein (TIGR02145 family)